MHFDLQLQSLVPNFLFGSFIQDSHVSILCLAFSQRRRTTAHGLYYAHFRLMPFILVVDKIMFKRLMLNYVFLRLSLAAAPLSL